MTEMRVVSHPIKIPVMEILMGCACLSALSVTAALSQSLSSQPPAKTTPEVLVESGKPQAASETNRRRASVEWRQRKLAVDAENAPLHEVLQQISAQTGIDFLNLDTLQKRVSVHFSNVSLEAGLQILLTGMDYASMGDPRDPSAMRIAILERTAPESTKDTAASEPPAQAEISPEETPESTTPEPETAQSETAESEDDPKPQLQAADVDPTMDLAVLGQALGDKRPDVHEAAIRALAERGGSEAVDLLQQAFRDSDSEAKMLLIENIGATPDVLPLLREAREDSDISVREAALAVIFDANVI